MWSGCLPLGGGPGYMAGIGERPRCQWLRDIPPGFACVDEKMKIKELRCQES